MGEPGTETRSNDANSVFFPVWSLLSLYESSSEVGMEQKRKGKGKKKCDFLVYAALHVLI